MIGRASLGFGLFALASVVHAEAGADAARGAELYRQCIACHQVGAGATNRVGPHLNALFGRAAATSDGFAYSSAMQQAAADGLVWDEERLDAFLANPRAVVARTKMRFGGVGDPQDRVDILAYLRTFSADAQNLPEAAPTAVVLEYGVAQDILALVGDPAYGEYLSGECTACHQTSGAANGIPSITNWPDEDFVIAMHAYKDGVREHPVMQMMAGRLSNEEIAALAAYFAGVQ